MRQRLSRRNFAKAGAAGLLLGGLSGCSRGLTSGSGQTIFRLALNQSEKHPSYLALADFATRLKEHSGGTLVLDIYANETLGAQAEALQLVSDDIIALAIVSGAQLENLNDDFLAYNMPGVFADVEHQMRVVNDPELSGELFSSLEGSNNITVLGGFTQGSRHVYANRPVTSPKDMAGLKIRVQESALHIGMINAMGAAATPMAYGEVYTALQSGVLSGAENNEVSYYSQQHYEVATHYSYTNHLVGLDYLIASTALLGELSDEHRRIFEEEWRRTSAYHTELWADETQKATEETKQLGAQYHEVDAEAFTKALEPLQGQFLTTDRQRRLYDAAVAAKEGGRR